MDLMQSLIASKLLGGGGGSEPVLKTKNIYENGSYAASADDADGYSNVTVNVPANVTDRTLNINGTFSSAVDNKDGYSSVTVNVQEAPVKTTSLSVTENGIYEPGPTSELSLTIPTIPDEVETDISAGATITNFDNLRIEFTNKTTGTTGHVDVYPSAIATQQIPMLFKNRTLIMGPDGDHYITIVNGYDSIIVLQKGYTITAMKLSTNSGLFNSVDVNVAPNVGTKSITDNGTYNASSDSLDGYSQVVVNVAGSGEPDELSSTEPRLKHFTQGGSTYVINSDGSMDWTWLGYSSIGNSFSGQVPLKNAKKIIIEIDEYGESYQHGVHVDTRNFNTAIGVTDIPVNDYIDLDNLQANNHIITDVEFNGNTYYGETNIHREINLTPYIGQDLYLFLQLPGVTLTGLKVTVLYDKFGIYEYHWSNDGKICVRKEIGCTKWFFCGLTKESGDIPVPEELVSYLPNYGMPGQFINTKAYLTPTAEHEGYYIGFVYPGTQNVAIRTWYETSLASGTFYGVLNISEARVNQDNSYIDPMNVEVTDETLLDKTIISNGTYRAEDEGYSGYSDVTINVPSSAVVKVNKFPIVNNRVLQSVPVELTQGKYYALYYYDDYLYSRSGTPNRLGATAFTRASSGETIDIFYINYANFNIPFRCTDTEVYLNNKIDNDTVYAYVTIVEIDDSVITPLIPS